MKPRFTDGMAAVSIGGAVVMVVVSSIVLGGILGLPVDPWLGVALLSALVPFFCVLSVYGWRLMLWTRSDECRRIRELERAKAFLLQLKAEQEHQRELARIERETNRLLEIDP